jgi:hypothetical protein
MAVVTVQNVIDRIRQRADLVNSQFVTDSELINVINAYKKELDDLLVGAYGEDYFAQSVTFSLAANTENTSLSALTSGTFYKLMGVEALTGGRWVDVPSYTFAERNRYVNNGVQPVWSNQSSLRHRVTGGNLSIRPTQNTAVTLGIYWTPQQSNLSLTTDTFDDVNGWSEFVVLKGAIYCKDKEESDTSELERDLSRMTARIEGMKSNRDESGPMKVTSVEGNDLPYWWLW